MQAERQVATLRTDVRRAEIRAESEAAAATALRRRLALEQSTVAQASRARIVHASDHCRELAALSAHVARAALADEGGLAARARAEARIEAIFAESKCHANALTAALVQTQSMLVDMEAIAAANFAHFGGILCTERARREEAVAHAGKAAEAWAKVVLDQERSAHAIALLVAYCIELRAVCAWRWEQWDEVGGAFPFSVSRMGYAPLKRRICGPGAQQDLLEPFCTAQLETRMR